MPSPRVKVGGDKGFAIVGAAAWVVSRPCAESLQPKPQLSGSPTSVCGS